MQCRRQRIVTLAGLLVAAALAGCSDNGADDVGPCGSMVVGLFANGMGSGRAVVGADRLELTREQSPQGLRVVRASVQWVAANHGSERGAPTLEGDASIGVRSGVLDCDDREFPGSGIVVLGVAAEGSAPPEWVIIYVLQPVGNRLEFVTGFPPTYRGRWTCDLEVLTRLWYPMTDPVTIQASVDTLARIVDLASVGDLDAGELSNITFGRCAGVY